MLVRWSAKDDYASMGGPDLVLASIREAVAEVPPEHRRELDTLIVLDRDPHGKFLGLWRPRREAADIELYLDPHVEIARRAEPIVRPFAFRLYLAHTIFHEIGHHWTLWLRRRTRPSKKSGAVDQSLERWAEEYVPQKLRRLCLRWKKPDGLAHSPAGHAALEAALRFLRLEREVDLHGEVTTARKAREKRARPGRGDSPDRG